MVILGIHDGHNASAALIKDGKLKITFDKPDEEHLNWRKQSRVTDVWILKQ